MTWFIYDDNTAERKGPFDDNQLRELIGAGMIRSGSTVIEREDGKQYHWDENERKLRRNRGGQDSSVAEPAKPAVSPSVAASPTYCTYCGQPVNAQAVACLSCGAKPVGHRNHCRNCGNALASHQIVCVKCGAAIGNSPGGNNSMGNLWEQGKKILESGLTRPPEQTTQALPGYRNSLVLTLTCIILTGFFALILMVSAMTSLTQYNHLQSALAKVKSAELGGEHIPWNEMKSIRADAIRTLTDAAKGGSNALISFFRYICYAALMIAFCYWCHCVVKNAHEMSAVPLRFSPGKSVAYWFIPILNFYRPFQALGDAFRAAEKPANWRESDFPVIVGLWWGASLAILVIQMVMSAAMVASSAYLYGRIAEKHLHSIEEAIKDGDGMMVREIIAVVPYWLLGNIAGCLLWAVIYLLLIAVMWSLYRKQEAAARR